MMFDPRIGDRLGSFVFQMANPQTVDVYKQPDGIEKFQTSGRRSGKITVCWLTRAIFTDNVLCLSKNLVAEGVSAYVSAVVHSLGYRDCI